MNDCKTLLEIIITLGLLSELFMEMLGMLPLQVLMEIMWVLLIVMLLLDGNNPLAPDYVGIYTPSMVHGNYGE